MPPSKLHYKRPPTQMASGKLKRFASVITDASATKSFLFSSRFLHLCGILRTVPAAMVIVLYSRSQQLLLEKLPQKKEMKTCVAPQSILSRTPRAHPVVPD